MVRFRFPRKIDPSKSRKSAQSESAAQIMDAGLSGDLGENIDLFKKLFGPNDTLVIRRLHNKNDPDVRCCLLFFDGMVDTKILDLHIIRPLMLFDASGETYGLLSYMQNAVVQANEIKLSEDIDEMAESMLYGDTLLLADGYAAALIINTKGWKSRAIEEPDTEKTLEGAKEGFTEALLVNLSMIRRRLKTRDLKFEFRTFGRRTRTKACICYIEGIAHQHILDELNRRLDAFDLDGALDAQYLREFISDAPHSPFSTVGTTERPGVAAAKMLEGRIAIVLDGTPVVLTLPFLFLEHMQSAEDYNLNHYYASFNRMLRIAALVFTVCVPAVFLSLVAFHQELIPTPLLISVTASHAGVPFPSVVEILGLLFVFEIIRETGVRMPSNIGQAFSIVGALVLGQAAVEAKFVCAPVVIVIAITGITNLMLPKLASAIMVLRILLVLVSAVLGLYGFIFLLTAILIHLFGLRSFGAPYMAYIGTLNADDLKDTVLRAPWWYMNLRPRHIAADRKRKSREDGRA